MYLKGIPRQKSFPSSSTSASEARLTLASVYEFRVSHHNAACKSVNPIPLVNAAQFQQDESIINPAPRHSSVLK